MTAEGARQPNRPVSRLAAVERWGEAEDVEGSVNDPRTREEHGIRFNEKWIYRLPGGGHRLIYWHRYDFRGALLEAPDGGVQPERL